MLSWDDCCLGKEIWEEAWRRYNEQIDRVESRITTRLREQLATAKNANEMLRIFSRHVEEDRCFYYLKTRLKSYSVIKATLEKVEIF